MMRLRWLAAWALLAACGDNGASVDPRTPYAARGPFTAGETTLHDANGNAVEVWYPAVPGSEAGHHRAAYDLRDWVPDDIRAKLPDADTPLFEMDAYRDLAASPAQRFPVVLFSHGLAGYRMQSSFLMTHLASWGFIVAAPDHLSRGLHAVLAGGTISDNGPAELRAALDLLRAEDVRAGGLLAGRLDFAHIATTGHSMGSVAATDLAKDATTTTWITYAGTMAPDSTVMLPSLMMAGSNDGLANTQSIQDAYVKQAPHKTFVSIAKAGHLAFSDICLIGRAKGGVLQIAKDHGVDLPALVLLLGSDGCTPDDLLPEKAWPLIDDFTVAHLRRSFGIDATPVGLGDDAAAAFSDRIYRFLHD